VEAGDVASGEKRHGRAQAFDGPVPPRNFQQRVYFGFGEPLADGLAGLPPTMV